MPAAAQAGFLARSNPVLNPGGSLWNAGSLAAAVSFWPKPAPQSFSVWGGMLSNALSVPKSLDFATPAPLAASFRAARTLVPDSLYAVLWKPAKPAEAAKATQAPASLPMPERISKPRTEKAPAVQARGAKLIAGDYTVPAEAKPVAGQPVRGGLQSFTAEVKRDKGRSSSPDLQASVNRMSYLFDGSRR